MHPRPSLSLILLALGALFLAACQAAPAAPEATPTAGPQPAAQGAPTRPPKPTGPKPKVVSTVAPITNLVLNVGGDRIELTGLVPEGTDSHTFEPAPSDARLLAEADLIVLNGLDLETPTEKLAQANKKPSAKVLKLGDNTITESEWIFDFSFPKSEGRPNPHLWMNPNYAMKYVQLIRDALAEVDPAGADYYRANAARQNARIAQLDRAARIAVTTIPQANRKLVTYHDSWAYFARAYGLKVIAAVQPSDFSEPSAKEVAEVIEQLKAEGVPAVFGSEVFPSKVLDQIAREAGVKYIDALRDDDLPGDPKSPEHTYIGMMVANLRAMVPALGGKVDALANLETGNTYEALGG